MIALVTEQQEELLQFRAEPWPYQVTFETPLEELERFVQAFLSLFSPQHGNLAADLIVFDPKTVLAFLSKLNIAIEDQSQFRFRAESAESIAELLQAVLSDWIDFVFVTSPPALAIYADHDEYTTFYTQDEASLNTLRASLEQSEFTQVKDWIREVKWLNQQYEPTLEQ